jgi:hypothetical protein
MTEQQEFELVARAAGIKLLRDPGGISMHVTCQTQVGNRRVG